MPKTIKTARGLARFAKAPYASRRKSLPRHSFETRQKALAIFQAGGSYK
ncbi:MAG TPA: transposase, partial [Sutterellaceae bacterium]|nr:transposase [Sutterellaceae bacterium]